ncbi:MAG: hypothetical protein LBS80_05240 [Tannerella sp.]|jgi:ABC-type phosphate transport system substrate-binding protein|nr:hypothetical protein [Tannerella sp.]
MKRRVILSVLISLTATFGFNLAAQEIQLESVKFVSPIIEKWVDEYKKAYPDSKLSIKVGTANGESGKHRIEVISGAHSESAGESGKIVYAGRYALVPVSNENNPLLDKVGKGLKRKDLRKLVFEKDETEEDYDDDGKEKYTATVYSRGGLTSISTVLAAHFDRQPEHIRGKKIIGDEIYLLDAVRKDVNGIAFNTLNYVFDLNTRLLKSNLQLLPLNLKSDIREALASRNIDNLIAILESTRSDMIPVVNFGLFIPSEYTSDLEVFRFITWALTKGQEYNHSLGFLTLDEDTLEDQKRTLEKDRLAYSQARP